MSNDNSNEIITTILDDRSNASAIRHSLPQATLNLTQCEAHSEDFLAEILLRSPRKLFISIIKVLIFRIKVSKNNNNFILKKKTLEAHCDFIIFSAYCNIKTSLAWANRLMKHSVEIKGHTWEVAGGFEANAGPPGVRTLHITPEQYRTEASSDGQQKVENDRRSEQSSSRCWR